MSGSQTVPRVHVRDLGNYGDKEELRRVFSKYGGLINVWIANNPPGFAYIFYETFEDAERAVEAMDGRKVCGVRVRVELSPVEDRRRSARGRGGGEGRGYDSKDSSRGRMGNRDRDKDYNSYNKGRGRSDDDNYRRGDGGRNIDSYDDYQENRYNRGRGRSGSRAGNYYEQGRGSRGGRGGRDNYGDNYGNKDGGGGRGGGNYGSGGSYSMRGSRGGRGGRGGNFRGNNYGYDRSGSRDGHYDDYSSRGRGRGRYNKQDNYSGGGWKRDNYSGGSRGGGGYRNCDLSERRGGGDMEYREQRTSRKEEFEGKGSYKRDGGFSSYSKYDKEYSDAGRGGKGDFHEGGGGHYSKAQQQYSRWDDDFEDEEDGGYRDRSPHHQKGARHSSGYQKPEKVSRSRSRSFDSHSFTSSHSRSQSSSPSLSGGGGRGGGVVSGTGKRTVQNNRKARGSDYNSSSRSPPISKSRFCSNLPTAYRDTFEHVGTFRSDSGYGSHQYPPENRSKLDSNYEQVEHRGYSSKEKRDISSGVRSVNDMSYGSRGDSGHFSKDRRGGDGSFSDRDYSVLQSSMADVSPPVLGHRSSQKRRR